MRIAPGRVVFGVVVAASLSGCMHAARVFLDLTELEGERQVGPALPEGVLASLMPKPPPPRPDIENVSDLDSVLALLPADASGGIDWVEAVRSGVIRPQPSESGVAKDTASSFGFDLYLAYGDGPDAYFPHSTHREWLTCESCHPGVYRSGRASFSPETAHDASSCGYCHSSVAFPVSACERCHEAASDLPTQRRSKQLGVTLPMERADGTSGQEGDLRFQGLDLVSAYPPARFPHGIHRLRYQCRSCHESPFPMVQGGTVMSETEAHSTEGCGSCHDGLTAFAVSMDECYRCHFEGDA